MNHDNETSRYSNIARSGNDGINGDAASKGVAFPAGPTPLLGMGDSSEVTAAMTGQLLGKIAPP
jgi:hypothetical protein